MPVPGKKVLIITREIVPFYYGGIGTQFKALAKLLRKHGHTVHFMSERPNRFDRDIFRIHYEDVAISFVDLDEANISIPRPLAFSSVVGMEFHKQYHLLEPDVVISADFEAEGLFPFLKSHSGAYRGTRFITTINGLTVHVSFPPDEQRAGNDWEAGYSPFIRTLHAMEKLCILSAETVVSPTLLAWEETRNLLGIRKTSRIIPNLTDEAFFQRKTFAEPSSVLDREGEKYLLFVGRLDRTKGADILLEAYLSLARADIPNLPQIIFVGRDCFWKEYGTTFLQHWMPRLSSREKERILFAGQIDHEMVAGYFRKAMLCVFPSRWETFGIVCLEAMAAGCPVIVSARTGLQEVIGSSLADYAVDVKAGGPLMLAERMLSVLRDRPNDLGDRLRSRAGQLMQQAETAWIDLINGMEARVDSSEDRAASWSEATHQLLLALSESEPEQGDRLKFYFRRRGAYSEEASANRIFPRFRWVVLRVVLPQGTGEEPLRMDPAEQPGLIYIKGIRITREQGAAEWVCDASTNFEGLIAETQGLACRQGQILVVQAITDDPQFFLHCPVIDEPCIVTVTLYVGDHPDSMGAYPIDEM